MNLNGARIYSEGVGLGHECEEKIRHIVDTMKSISPTSEVSMKFLKAGNLYEGLLWGKANDVPIGVYNRGLSMTHVLDALYKKVKKQAVKAWKMKSSMKPSKKVYSQIHEHVAMAG